MFKFDFSPSAEGGGDTNISLGCSGSDEANVLIDKLRERSKTSAETCVIIEASSTTLPEASYYEKLDLLSSKLSPLGYAIPQHKMANNRSDLITGVYEGGLKVWECSIDLCRFLAEILDERSPTNENVDLKCVRDAVKRSIESGGSTMELGCGHGLPGCLILRGNIQRASLDNMDSGENEDGSVVIFTDFNDFVLHHATIPNASINIYSLCQADLQPLWSRAIFAGGDWMGLSHKLTSGNLMLPLASKSISHSGERKVANRFDLILASETTYTPESCQDTAFLMLQHLKIDIGVGLVATKRFYFGVGGGTDLFSNKIEILSSGDHDLRLVVRTIRSYDTGNANIRDLLEVRCHRK